MSEEKTVKVSKFGVYSLIAILILLLILLLFLYLIRSPLLFRSGAYTSTTVTNQTEITGGFSKDNSYIFASPLRAKVGGEKIRITVYVLDDRGLGMYGKKVEIGSGNTLEIAPVQPTTDGQGRAIFDVASVNYPGVFIIQASADGVELTQKTSISFD